MSSSEFVFVAFYYSGPENLQIWDRSKASWQSVFAVSGGGRGQKLKNTRLPYGENESRLVTSFTFTTKKDAKTGVRGGPIPPGIYKIKAPEKHPRLGRAAFLAPDKSNEMFNRGEFFIHGAGQSGSDGCIVPGDSSVWPILDLVTDLHKHYKGKIHLKVIGGTRELPAEQTPGSDSAMA